MSAQCASAQVFEYERHPIVYSCNPHWESHCSCKATVRASPAGAEARRVPFRARSPEDCGSGRRVCTECVQSVYRVCTECVQSVHRVCTECVQ